MLLIREMASHPSSCLCLWSSEDNLWLCSPGTFHLRLEVVSLVSLEFLQGDKAAQLALWRVLEIHLLFASHLPLLWSQTCATRPRFLCGCWVANSGPHLCEASSLLTEPPSRLLHPYSRDPTSLICSYTDCGARDRWFGDALPIGVI